VDSQRAILVWDESTASLHKKRRRGQRVTFAWVPGLRSDENQKEFNDKLNAKKSRRSRVIKDLPMEGISLIGRGAMDY
jgi:hypothetical protein